MSPHQVPRASGSELGMAITMAEGLGGGSRAHRVPRTEAKAGEKESRKNIHQRVFWSGGQEDRLPPKVHRTKETSVLWSADAETYHSDSGAWRVGGGGPSGTVPWSTQTRNLMLGDGVQDLTGLRCPQPLMTRLMFSVPPSCFALPGAPLSVTSFHHTFAKGAAECCTPELVWAWSTAGLAAHTSLPCPDALLPGETRGSLRPAGDWHSGTETPAGDDGSGHLARDWAATFPPQTSGSAESKKWGC